MIPIDSGPIKIKRTSLNSFITAKIMVFKESVDLFDFQAIKEKRLKPIALTFPNTSNSHKCIPAPIVEVNQPIA